MTHAGATYSTGWACRIKKAFCLPFLAISNKADVRFWPKADVARIRTWL